MRCQECDHQNTEGAWLCINCGAKLPRPETQDASAESSDAPAGSTAESDEPSRFAPQISENLRRLRDRTERERARQRPARQSSPGSGGSFLGIPIMVWGLVAFVFVAFVYAMSALQ
jgi:cobalamin biosynthesis Mg chelatase CobN